MVTKKKLGTVATEEEGSRRQRRRDETRERLVQAAMMLFSSKGMAGTRVEEITQAADVGKGTFFNYFPSKEHVLAYLVARQKSSITDHLEMAKEGKLPIFTVLQAMARELAALPGKSPEMARSLTAAIIGSPEVREYILREICLARRWIVEIIALGQKRGELDGTQEPEMLAIVFHQMLFGTLLLWALEPASSLQKRLTSTMEAFFSGVAVRPEGKKSSTSRNGMPARKTRVK